MDKDGLAPEEIDALIDRSIAAAQRGELPVEQPAGEQSSADPLLPVFVESDPLGSQRGQLRRLTMMFCDLVGSTELSTRHDPERYRALVGEYVTRVEAIVEDRYGGHIVSRKGDGLLVAFGYPAAHEDDAARAVMAGLDLVQSVRGLSRQTEVELGETLEVRIGVHNGDVLVDIDQDDVFGLGANVASRLHGLAEPQSVLISEAVRRLVADRFELEEREPELVKGVDVPLSSWRVTGRRRLTVQDNWATPLVGRDSQLIALHHAWNHRPGAVLVHGEAGIGKSRLARALINDLGTEVRIIELDASELHMDTGFHPLGELMARESNLGSGNNPPDALVRLRAHLELTVDDSERLIPYLAPVLGLSPDAGYSGAALSASMLQGEIESALLRYLLGLVSQEPTLMLVEDAHWLDESTARVIAALTAQMPEDLLIVTTSRSDPQHSATGVSIGLQRLGPNEIRVIAEALDPDAKARDCIDDIVARSDGVPLFVEELALAAVERPARVAPTMVPEEDAAVPHVLYEPICARLHTYPDGAAIASVAAVIGRTVDTRLLERIAPMIGVDGSNVRSVIDALRVRNLVEDRPGSQDEVAFRHELVRQVAYGLQPPSIRRSIHGAVADLLAESKEEGAAVDSRKLAEHYERAERWAQAVYWHERSAETARDRGALDEAIRELTRGLSAGEAGGEIGVSPRDELRIRLRRGFLIVSTEGNASAQAARDFERGLQLVTDHPPEGGVWSALVSLWAYYAARGDLTRAHQVSRLGEVLRERESDRFMQVHNSASFGILDWFRGEFVESDMRLSDTVLNQIGDEYRPAGDSWSLPNDPVASMYTHIALARFMRGDPEGAQRALSQAESRCHVLAFPEGPFTLAYALSWGSWIDIHAGNFDSAQAKSDHVAEIADRHGFDFWRLPALTQQAAITVERAILDPNADLDSTDATLEGLSILWKTLDAQLLLPWILTMRAKIALHKGAIAEASAHVEESFTVASDTGLRHYEVETVRVAASLDSDSRLERLQEGIDMARSQGALPFELRCALDLYQIEPSLGSLHLEHVVSRYQVGSSSPYLRAAFALLGLNR